MRLTTFCSIQVGLTTRTRLEPVAQGGILAIQLRDISSEGRIDITRLSRVHLDSVPERYLVGHGDVVFRSRGEWNTASAIGNQFVEPALAVMPLFILRPNREIVIPEYLAWAINQPPAQRHFAGNAQGGSMRMVPKSSLDDLELDMPDLATQRQLIIVNDLADQERTLAVTIAEKRRRLTDHLLIERTKVQSVRKSGVRK